MSRARPLDGFRSIKAKLGILVGASVIVAVLVAQAGSRAGVPGWLTMPVTVVVALLVTQWLARGMTSPLREMTAATAVMATGDHSRRVTATSLDEVGELARAFNVMAGDLAAADQQRRQLVATVSHELRTPLAAQQALLENLVDGVVSPDSESLRTALAQAERLSGLVTDLLDLSRVDGGVARLDIGLVDVEAVVGQGVAEARAQGGAQRGIRIKVAIADGAREVEADAGRLAQVVANLLDNAVRHSPEGGIVTVRADSLDGDRWALEVTDEGPGIPPDRAERVFARFGSWDNSGGGTGLGLAIASWVCELHGGSIAVIGGTDEDSGRGARVRAVLPKAPRLPSAGYYTEEKLMPDEPGPAGAGTLTAREMPSGPVPPMRPVQPVADSTVAQLFGRAWPEKDQRPRPGLVLGSVAVGVLAAIILPAQSSMGLGLLLVLLAAGGVILAGSVRRREPWTMMLAVTSLALASLLVLRAAEWVTVLAVLAAAVLAMAGLTGALSFGAMVAAMAAWVLAAIRGLPLLGHTLNVLSRRSSVWPVVRTVAVTLVVLVVFGGLFASGDAIFGSWADRIVPDMQVDGFINRAFVGFFVGGIVLAATYVAVNPPPVEKATLPPATPVRRRFEWIIPLGMLIAIFMAFVAAQATAMWGGHDYVQRTTGLTYAEYVHQGFGQLVAVTFLTLITVAIVARKAPRATSVDRALLTTALGLLGSLALAVVASALYRMHVYQEAYGFTVMRLLVTGFELWMGFLLVLVLIATALRTGRWIPRAALVSGALLILGIGLMNPEAWVAEHNIERYAQIGKIDLHYLRSLGPDATPAIIEGLPRGLAECIIAAPQDSGSLIDWNLGRSRAAQAAEGFPDAVRLGCEG
ncbi:DUF4173 domain-containing protein [Hoyosella rhizosphaerae]|uniref:histidine kinase n=2 Tax=Hoyosella rhizosphaerae TaxID=1755582 RepID=A0A916U0S6_9ACTN|nr:DUF4153 domain-containing protein [Hoyosella rhizosphaerae]MBN4926862.1 DUF4173 domain-containing protein [Hoyosella rhizosphaerae]GGC55932.1 hypothetical protein GCM10011410_05420 [Hoyosella rhizosphaerae]